MTALYYSGLLKIVFSNHICRKEGETYGELGAQGFWNCKFWFGRTGFHPLYESVKQEVLAMDLSEFDNSPTVKAFVSNLSGGQAWHPGN